MKSLETVYSNEYITTTYFNKICTQCSNKCDKCTVDKMEINRYIVRKNGEDIPTASYKCTKYINSRPVKRKWFGLPF